MRQTDSFVIDTLGSYKYFSNRN